MRYISIYDFVVGNACAGRVCDGNTAVFIDFHQSGYAEHRIGAKGFWVEKFGIDAPIDHVDALKSTGRSHRYKAIGDDEVSPFDQFDAHLLGEKGVFKIGGVVDAGGEYSNRWRCDMGRGQRAQCVEQLRGIVIDVSHMRGFEYFWKYAFENFPIFEHIRHARRTAQVVFEDVKLPVCIAHEVNAGNVTPHISGGREADTGFEKFFGCVDDVAGNDAVFEDFLIGVNVADKEVEGLDALFEALFDIGPIGMRNDARDDVEGENFFNAGFAAIHVERDAHVHQGQFGGLMAFLEFVFG